MKYIEQQTWCRNLKQRINDEGIPANEEYKNTYWDLNDGTIAIDVSTATYPNMVVLIDSDQLGKALKEVGHRWYVNPKKNLEYLASRGVRVIGGGRGIKLASLIMDRGSLPLLDHIDRNDLNCLESNMRPATYLQNVLNSGLKRNNKLGVTGVSLKEDHKRRKPYYAHISVDGEKEGDYFATLEEAVAARKQMELKRAHLNLKSNGHVDCDCMDCRPWTT